MIKRQHVIIFFFTACLCAFGLFYEFALFFADAVLAVILMCQSCTKGQFVFVLNKMSAAMIIIVLFSVGTCFYGIDKGLSFIGVIRTFAVFILMLLAMHLSEQEKNIIYMWISHLGTLVIVVCAIIYFIEPAKPYFWQAGRLGGTFQYSNTCALFFLLGIINCLYQKERETHSKSTKKPYWKDLAGKIVEIIILIVGIMLTGSRSVFVLLLILMVIYGFRNKKYRFLLLGMLLCLILGGVLYAFFTDDFQTFGRFLTIRFTSSTLIGRLLYWRDAFFMILKYPFGSGYKGYSYLQKSIQTGVYSTMFVHNDLIQLCLDYGVIAALPAAAAVICEVFNKKDSHLQTLMLAVIILYSLFDFDLQYPLIAFIFFMLFSWEKGRKIIVSDKICKSCGINVVLLMTYFSIVFGASYFGNKQLSLKMYPFQTGLLVEKLENAESESEAVALADKIISLNKNISSAYDARALSAAINNDFDLMIYNKEKALYHNKYALFEYADYLNLLKRSLVYYEKMGDYASYQKNAGLMKTIPNRLEKVKKETSALGWKIKDKPELELSDNIIRELEGLQ